MKEVSPHKAYKFIRMAVYAMIVASVSLLVTTFNFKKSDDYSIAVPNEVIKKTHASHPGSGDSDGGDGADSSDSSDGGQTDGNSDGLDGGVGH